MDISRNVQEVLGRVVQACQDSARTPDAVTVIGVTKYVDISQMKALLAEGITNLGENRVQDAQDKLLRLQEHKFTAHMIGHLQRNKVKRCLELFDMIHSVDSWRLALEIDKEGRRVRKVMPCLLQVNVSGEESKSGFAPRELERVLPQIGELEHLSVKGLMTMAPFSDDPEEARPVFRGLRELAQKLKGQEIPGIDLAELSMGMSNDFEVAIQEGATMVRIGSAFFAE